MYVALVEHPQHDVNRGQSGGDQQRFASQRVLVRLRGPRKADLDGLRKPHLLGALVNRIHGVPQSHARREIEGQGDCREQSLVRDG